MRNVRDYLDCPCCGDVGAWADPDGLYHDGDPLVCGCAGQVSLDSETLPYVCISDDPSDKCSPEAACWGIADDE